MNTITSLQQVSKTFSTPAENTPDLYLDRDQFIAFRDAFKKLAREKRISKEDIILYNIIRGLPIERGFTPITNSTKLSNGTEAHRALATAKFGARYKMVYQLDAVNERFGNFLGTLPHDSWPTDAKLSVVQKMSKRSAFAEYVYEELIK